VIGDESNLSEVVVDAGTDAKARDVSRVDRRFFGGDDFAGEELEATSEKNPASDSANTRKAREVRAHNFHSYKKDNTLLARFLAIQIFAPCKKFLWRRLFLVPGRPKNSDRPIRAGPSLQSLASIPR
jgi:hypothetical protein